MTDFYRLLQVHERADTEIIEAAYRRLARRHHPDVSGDPLATHTMQAINRARSVLVDPVKRRRYDRLRRRLSEPDGRRRIGFASKRQRPGRATSVASGARDIVVSVFRTLAPRRPIYVLAAVLLAGGLLAVSVVAGAFVPRVPSPVEDLDRRSGDRSTSIAESRPGPAPTPYVRGANPDAPPWPPLLTAVPVPSEPGVTLDWYRWLRSRENPAERSGALPEPSAPRVDPILRG